MEIKITDHAVIRYLERVKGIDINIIRNQIIKEEIIPHMKILGGSGRFPIKDNYIIVMKDYKVITIL